MTEPTMIKSMTGYGKGEDTTPFGRFVVEIRSVNHRYSEISVKLPRQFLFAENDIRKKISGRLKRGKIDLFVQYEPSAGENGKPSVNLVLAKAYYDAFKAMRQALGIQDTISLEMIASQKDVMTFSSDDNGRDELAASLDRALEGAISQMEKMRFAEGESLASDILERIKILDDFRQKVEQRAPEAIKLNNERLKERLKQLMCETSPDESRIIQEAAIIADKSDITEETVRFKSHIGQISDAMMKSGEPIGRKLDFIIQEMNREVNTIGSKSADIEISSFVVAMKAEIEKIREQIQNIE